MSYVGDVITEIRYDVNDSSSTRFTDALVLSYVKKAVRRANRIAQRNGLNFAKKSASLTTVASTAYVSLPDDFDSVIGKDCLFRDSDHTIIQMRTEREWEMIETAAALENFIIDQVNSRINLNGTPSAAETLTFWYYPTISTSAWTTSTMATDSMPWSGRIDDIIAEYVGLRLKNIDEMDASFDLQIMTDMENQIIQAYNPISPNIVDGSGWLNGMT